MSEAGLLLQRFLQGHPRVFGLGGDSNSQGAVLLPKSMFLNLGNLKMCERQSMMIFVNCSIRLCWVWGLLQGMSAFALVLTSLGFFICISMAAFGCKAALPCLLLLHGIFISEPGLSKGKVA
ncbi:uncharacterized protein PHA67_008129 [Liasis olivaceus]